MGSQGFECELELEIKWQLRIKPLEFNFIQIDLLD